MQRSLYNLLWFGGKIFQEPKIYSYLRRKKSTEKFTRQEIEQYQLVKLRRLLNHAYDTTVFYREYFTSAGVLPNDIRTLEDFSRLPVVTKDDIRSRIDDFVSSSFDVSSLRKIFSGGSTGVPTMVYHSPEMHAFTLAQHVTFMRWMGLTRGDKTAFVWGLNRQNLDYEISKKNKLRWFLRNTMLLDAFDMTPAKMGEFVLLLKEFAPALIIGYTSALNALAEYIIEHRIELRGIRAVQSTAESLSERQRTTIQQAFGCPVFNQYGSTEIMWIAAECNAHQGLHIFEDCRIVQAFDTEANGRGEFSELIVTDLENYGAPLIRYKNHDIGIVTQEPCNCGMGFSRIVKLGGRISDMFVLSDGRKIHGEFFTHVFYEYKDIIKQFQLHQTGLDMIVVRIAYDAGADIAARKQSIEKILLRQFKDVTGDVIAYRFEYPEKIPNEGSGKFRFTKSDLAV